MHGVVSFGNSACSLKIWKETKRSIRELLLHERQQRLNRRVVIAFIDFIEVLKNRHNQRNQRIRYRLLVTLEAKGSRVIGSSDQVYVVDALAITGDEGRESLRKAVGSWQISFDPQMSEWGNPPVYR